MGRPLWQLLISKASHDKEEELTCEECLRVLDYFVDWILLGGDPGRVKMLVTKHLLTCDHCWLQLERKFEERERILEVGDNGIHPRVSQIWEEKNYD